MFSIYIEDAECRASFFDTLWILKSSQNVLWVGTVVVKILSVRRLWFMKQTIEVWYHFAPMYTYRVKNIIIIPSVMIWHISFNATYICIQLPCVFCQCVYSSIWYRCCPGIYSAPSVFSCCVLCKGRSLVTVD